MKETPIILSTLLIAPTSTFATSLVEPTPANAKVYFVHPTAGQTVQSTLKVVFGLTNMGVAPAGIDVKNTGHHHLLIDTHVLPDMTRSLPATDKIKRFSGGQTETEITLAPGTHTLQLLIGNFSHMSHSSPVISKKLHL